MIEDDLKPPQQGLRRTLYEVIFEAEDGPGRNFDLVLLVFIVVSVLAVVLESVPVSYTHLTLPTKA